MTGVIVYFVLCSMNGVRNIGIWFLWIRVSEISPASESHEECIRFDKETWTPPQRLLTACCIFEQLRFLFVLLTDVQGGTKMHVASGAADVSYLRIARFPVCLLTDVQGATKTCASSGAADVLYL